MKQKATPQEVYSEDQQQHGYRLAPLLCWAVVLADAGISIYYVPGILYGNIETLAGFFVLLTLKCLYYNKSGGNAGPTVISATTSCFFPALSFAFWN